MKSSNAISPSTRARRRAPLTVGLTGGVASGKSTVAGLFAALGAAIIDTDQIARDIVAPGTPALAAVVARFGEGVLTADGSLDRRALRQIVFADAAALRDLEALTHPAIAALTQQRVAAVRGPYVLIAVPLLAEKGLQARYDRVLVVDCDPALQLRRLMVRDGSTAAEAAAILATQANRELRLSIANDVIVNDGDIVRLALQVEKLHALYLDEASRHK